MPASFRYQHLLTGHGELWDLNEQGVRKLLNSTARDIDLATHAVADLGFIYLQQRADRIKVRLRPDVFPKRAFEALALELSRRFATRIIIEFAPVENGRSTSFASQVFLNLQDAVAHLDALRSLTPGEIERPHFLATELDLKRLSSQGRQKLRSAYTNWKRANGELSKRRLSLLRGSPLDAPFLLTQRNSNGAFVIQTWPKYLTLVPQNDVSNVLGSLIDELPYPGSYPSEAAAGFRDVSKQSTPILDLVEAVIHYQSGPQRRVRYERLCLPWRGPSGEEFVSTVSSFRSKRVIGG